MTSLARRSRCASARSMCSDTSGRSRRNGVSASCLSDASTASVTALAEEVRGLGSNKDSSPNISPGPMTLSKFSRPSAAARVSFILPSITTYRASPSSPSIKRCSPRESFTSAICLRRVRAPSSSSASNRGARLSTPSVLSTGPPCCQPCNTKCGSWGAVLRAGNQSIPRPREESCSGLPQFSTLVQILCVVRRRTADAAGNCHHARSAPVDATRPAFGGNPVPSWSPDVPPKFDNQS